MHRVYRSIIFISLIALISVACKHEPFDEDNDQGSQEIPASTLTITNPPPNTVFGISETVNIRARAVSTADIHGYDLVIRQAGVTTPVLFEHIHDHNDTVLIDYNWKVTTPAGSSLDAEVTIYLDHQGNTKSARVPFRVQ